MKKPAIIITLILVAGAAVWIFTRKNKVVVRPSTTGKNTMFKITSPAFSSGDVIPMEYTCDGQNINPPLRFEGAPEGTKSLVLIVDDPDAPVGTWTHWLLWDIPSTVTYLNEKEVPPGAIQGKTSSGKNEYGGPCPPSGTHRYFFKLFALDELLPVDENSTREQVESAMQGHILDQAELMGRYSRA